MRLLNRVSSLGTTSFSKPILLFCILALTPALIFNALIITGCTTTAASSRKFYLVQFKYNPESEFYKSMLEAELAAESGGNDKEEEVQIKTTLSIPTKLVRLKQRAESDLKRLDGSRADEDAKDEAPKKEEPEKEEEPEESKEEEEEEDKESSPAETSTPTPPPPPPPTSPTFTQIRIGYRGICVEHTSGWDCAPSHDLLQHKDLSSDPSNLVTIADLYLDKISWSIPFWISLVTISVSYLLIIFNALPLPCLSPPLWTKKVAVVSLGIAAVASMGSMILSGVTTGAVATLISTITLEAIEVHTGRAVLVFGWFTFALVLLPFLALGALVIADWGVGRVHSTIDNTANQVLEKATGGRYDTNHVRGLRRDFSSASTGSLRSGTLRGGNAHRATVADEEQQQQYHHPTNSRGAESARMAIGLAQKLMEKKNGGSGGDKPTGLGLIMPKASGFGMAR